MEVLHCDSFFDVIVDGWKRWRIYSVLFNNAVLLQEEAFVD